jgi:alkylation response protein AidB-like acyl-CoA dehydrogenase
MRRPLPPRQQEIVDLAAGLADTFAQRATEHDRDSSFPFDNYGDLRSSGYLALTVPEELGGRGASLYEMFLAQERLAMGDGATALAVNMHVNGMGQWGSIWRITGSPALEDVLRRAGRGELIWAGLTSERGVENVLLDATTTATAVEGGFLINGRKIFCTNIEVATDYSVTVRCEDPNLGPQLMIVRVSKDADGLTKERTWDVLGMRSTQSIDLTFENVRIDADAVLHSQPIGHFNEVTVRTILGWGQSSFGAVYTGIAAGAMWWAKEQVRKRNRDADPAVRDHFARMEILLETSRAVLYRHAHEVAEGTIYEQLPLQEIIARASVSKVVPVANALDIMRLIVDVVGGPTFMRREPFERMWRDMQAGPIMPMSNLAARRVIGATVFGDEVAPSSEATVLLGTAAG